MLTIIASSRFAFLTTVVVTMALTNTALEAQQPPPMIAHTPIKSSPRGKPLNIIAQIDGRGKDIASATLHFRQGVNAAPVNLPMEKTTVGTWYGTIPSSYLSNKGIVQYYIEAANSAGEWTETVYYTVSVVDPNAPEVLPVETPNPPMEPTGRPPASAGKNRAWVMPTILIGGGALAVAGAVALADSSGSSSSQTPDTPGDDGGTDVPITDRVITRTASDSSNGVGIFPSVKTIDASDAVGQSKVGQVRIDFSGNPLDGFEEHFQVIYEGKTVIDTGPIFVPSSRNVTVSGTSTMVTIQVVSSRADNVGLNNYNWNATATFFLAE